NRSRSTRPSVGRRVLNRSHRVQAVRKRTKAASWRRSASFHARNSSHIRGVVCPSRRISQAAATAGMSFPDVIGLSAPAEALEEGRLALGNGLVEQGAGAMARGFDQLLFHGVLADVH